MRVFRGLCVGAGYFAQFHFDAWRRIEGAQIVGVCDRDLAKARRAADFLGANDAFDDFGAALCAVSPDFVDIITPPDSHLDLVAACARQRVSIICQKPLAPDFVTAERIVQSAEQADVRLMVHENFRFQPWHRELKSLLDAGAIGGRLHSLSFRTRTGDGSGDAAYLGRQPYFRQMPRFLIHETGVHFVDLFRFLGGEITEVSAHLRRLNSVIAGEDAALVVVRFASGATGLWDANRFNDSTAADPRLTFGEFLIEGNGGSLRLYGDGRITVQPLGGQECTHDYNWNNAGFGGDCVYATQRHFIECLESGAPFETGGREYLQTLRVVEAVYDADRMRGSVTLQPNVKE
jgi:predicted dehydrogenase